MSDETSMTAPRPEADGDDERDDLARLEETLRTLRPAPVPLHLAARLHRIPGVAPANAAGEETPARAAAGPRREARSRTWPWMAAAAALVALVAVTNRIGWPSGTPGPSPSPSATSPTPAAAAGVAAADPSTLPPTGSPLAFRPLDRARRIVRTLDGGVISAPGIGAFRPVAFEAVEETRFESESGDARLSIETPRDGVLLVPVTLY